MKNLWRVVLGLVIGLLVSGIIWLASSPPRGNPIKLLPPPSPIPIKVHVTGEVHNPDVYALPLDSRVQDAVEAAGGFTDLADSTALNLAAPLQDGSQVHIPTRNDAVIPDSKNSNKKPEDLYQSTPTPDLNSNIHTKKFVNINTADQITLETLSGIGPVIAENIIAYREENGPFKSIEEIQKVYGIGPAKFDRIKDLIIVDDLP